MNIKVKTFSVLNNKYYNIGSNKGYGSKQHMSGIKIHGISPWHRKTFGICKNHKVNKRLTKHFKWSKNKIELN